MSENDSDALRLPYYQLEAEARPVPAKQHEVLQSVTATHVASFDFLLSDSLPAAVDSLYPAYEQVGDAGRHVQLTMRNVQVGMPAVGARNTGAIDRNCYPAECRERRTTYAADLSADIVAVVENPDGTEAYTHIVRKSLGQVSLPYIPEL